jgi:hypothetical protein
MIQIDIDDGEAAPGWGRWSGIGSPDPGGRSTGDPPPCYEADRRLTGGWGG